MGIRFVELTAESRALVDRIVARGGVAARSDEPPLPKPGAPAPPAAAPAPPPAARPQPPPARAPAPAGTPGLRGPAVRPAPAGTPVLRGPAVPLAPGAGAAPSPAGGPAPARRGRYVIGIDLGTTNSCAAVARGAKAVVLQSKQGHRTIPSIVAYDEHGRLLVGHAAKAQMIVNPQHTVYGSKRLVGRPFASPTVQACRDRFHYEIVEAPDGAAAVRFAGRDYSLQQVSALVLREIREMASQALGEQVERAVVTVPAYYDDHQRSAVREAAKLAGLQVERIVNEPTAAALAFGFGKGLDARVLVYDLGGGTFDASVLEIRGDVYEVVSTGGDTFLGGVDFDAQLVDHLAWKFEERYGFAPPADRVVWQRIRDAAEEHEGRALLARVRGRPRAVPLPQRGRHGVRAQGGGHARRAREDDGAAGRPHARGVPGGAREEEPLRRRTSTTCSSWAARAGCRSCGAGSPRSSAASRARGSTPTRRSPSGAALLADSSSRIDSVVLIDALPMGIGVGLPGGRMVTVLPRNTALPTKRAYEHATSRDGQTRGAAGGLPGRLAEGRRVRVPRDPPRGRPPGAAARRRARVRSSSPSAPRGSSP